MRQRGPDGRFLPVTDLEVRRVPAGSRVIDLTDTAVERETRLRVRRKIDDRKIVNEAKALIGAGVAPALIIEHVRGRVAETGGETLL